MIFRFQLGKLNPLLPFSLKKIGAIRYCCNGYKIEWKNRFLPRLWHNKHISCMDLFPIRSFIFKTWVCASIPLDLRKTALIYVFCVISKIDVQVQNGDWTWQQVFQSYGREYWIYVVISQLIFFSDELVKVEMSLMKSK